MKSKKRARKPATDGIAGDVLSAIIAEYGDDSATSSGSEMFGTVKDWVSTQCYPLDLAIGHPGIPSSRLTSIRGKESSGKTTIATHILAEIQRRGGLTFYFDAEFAFDLERASQLGLHDAEHLKNKNEQPLIVIQPDYLEQVFEQIEYVVTKAHEIDPDILIGICWDSVAGTPSKAELEGKYDDVQPGIHARRVSRAFRKCTKFVARHRVVLILIEQMKDAIGGGPAKFMGSQTATIAEKPISFHASVRMEVTRIGPIEKERKSSTGIESRVRIIKNKVAPPFREAIVPIRYATGIDNDRCILDMARERGLIEKAGGYLRMKGTKDNFRESAWPHVDCFDDVSKMLRIAISQEQKEVLETWQRRKAEKKGDVDYIEDDEEDGGDEDEFV